MRKYLLLFVLLMGVGNLFAQGKYAFTLSDYVNDRWEFSDSLKMERRTQGNKFWSGGADFRPIVENDETDKLLKKQVRFVICNDTLFVNCRSLKYGRYVLGKGYALGFRLGEDKVCFISMTVGKSEAMKAGAMGGLFGALGGAITAADMLKNQSCYIIASDANKVERITPAYMEETLKEFPDLLDSYNSIDKKRRGAADVVIEYLSKLHLLHKY